MGPKLQVLPDRYFPAVTAYEVQFLKGIASDILEPNDKGQSEPCL